MCSRNGLDLAANSLGVWWLSLTTDAHGGASLELVEQGAFN